MITKEQIEKIAADCGVEVTYAEKGKGGFIIDDSGMVHTSLNDIWLDIFAVDNNNRKRYMIDEENFLLAA